MDADITKVVFNNTWGSFWRLSEEAVRWLKEHEFMGEIYSESGRCIIPRHHPLFVQCVETLGERVNGDGKGGICDLAIAEVEGTLYYIVDNDGKETVIGIKDMTDSQAVSEAEGIMDEEQYIELVEKLTHLALTLPPDPSDDDVERFLGLEALADRYERQQDLGMGLIEMQYDTERRLWFHLARKAREIGMATNDYVIVLLCHFLDLDPQGNSRTATLRRTPEGVAIIIPENAIKKMESNDDDKYHIEYRGKGLVIWIAGKNENESDE